MRTTQVEFTDSFLKNLTHDPAGRNGYSDKLNPGLSCWVAKNHKVTLRLRARINGKRRPAILGTYGELTAEGVPFRLKQIKEALADQTRDWKHGKLVKRQHGTTLEGLMEKYREAVRTNNRKARRRNGLLPVRFETNVKEFKRIYAPVWAEPLAELTADKLNQAEAAYLDERERETGKRPLAMVATAQRSLRPILRFAARSGWMPVEEVEQLDPAKSKKNKRFLLPREVQTLCPHLDAMPDQLGLFLRFLVYTVARLTQSLNLRWRDLALIDLPDELNDEIVEVMIWTVPENYTKSKDDEGEARVAFKPIVGAARQIIESLRPATYSPDDFVFSAIIRNLWGSQRHATTKALQAACKVYHWHRHTMRHTGLTYLGYVDADYKTKGLALTHKHATEIYDHSTAYLKLTRSLQRMHQLFNDMETGRLSAKLASVQGELQINPDARKFMGKYSIGQQWLKIDAKEVETPHEFKRRVVA